jgi:hypothetical protein
MAVRMRRPFRIRQISALLAGAAVLALSTAGTPALAQAVSPEDMASARTLGIDGVKMADSGDCAGAIPKLAAAEKIFHAPTTMDRLGECEIKVGKIVAGTEHLQRVIREPLAPNAPQAFVTARQRAQDALTPALPRIAHLKIRIDGVTADKVTATVDGAPVSSALFDVGRPTDPGAHEVQASAQGFKTATATVTLADGSESTASLHLDPDPNAAAAAATTGAATGGAASAATGAPAPQAGGQPAAAPAGATTAAPAQTGAPPAAHPPVAAIAMLVVGGVGVGIGTVFGVLAMGAKSTLDGECGSSKKACPKQSDINALNTDALVSDIGFGVGVVGLAIGTVMLVTHKSTETGSTRKGVVPWVGLGSAGLRGTFE